MRELFRHGPGGRHAGRSIDHSQQSAYGRGLVVRIETQGAAYEQGLLYVTLTVEQGEYSHRSVQVGVPYGLGLVGLIGPVFLLDDLARLLPVLRILVIEFEALVYGVAEAVSLRKILLGMPHEGLYVAFEEGLGVHCSIDHGRRGSPVVGSDAGSPLGDACRIGRHTRSGVSPDLVDKLRVDLEPVRVVALVTGERRREPVVHGSEGGAVCKPHAVADMVHPTLANLGVGRMDTIFLHHQKIEVLHIRIIIGEGSVHGGHLAYSLVEHERRFTRLFNEFVLILESVDIAHHLPQPGPGYLVVELGVADFGCLRFARAGDGQNCGQCSVKYLFH